MNRLRQGLPDAKRSARMRKVLQEQVVPALRELGFRGTKLHFYRQRAERLDLLYFQFSNYGQQFL